MVRLDLIRRLKPCPREFEDLWSGIRHRIWLALTRDQPAADDIVDSDRLEHDVVRATIRRHRPSPRALICAPKGAIQDDALSLSKPVGDLWVKVVRGWRGRRRRMGLRSHNAARATVVAERARGTVLLWLRTKVMVNRGRACQRRWSVHCLGV